MLNLLLIVPLLAPATQPTWHNNYATAMAQAKSSKKMMVVYFYDSRTPIQQQSLYAKLTTDRDLYKLTQSCTMAYIPTNQVSKVNGKQIKLIEHGAFAELGRSPGLVMIDFTNPKDQHYGHVVTIYPLSVPNSLNRTYLYHLFQLPKGASLTQRTLTWAVRVHPENPQSTYGQFSPYLAEEARSHSQYQASILNQGHHNWNARFQRISSRLGNSAQEVCAESWPGEPLVVAAIECVHSWRQSSGHWSAVRSRHTYWGYDMKRGRNNIWYATGLFSTR
jgi:hypothetical protein